MARTDETWEEVRGTFLQTVWRAGRDILINGYNHYLNFGIDSGEDGYGFRDHDGMMQFKNESGLWDDIGSGSGSGAVNEIVAGPYITVNSSDPAKPIVGVDGVEPALGNPATNDYILSSKIDGTRSWVSPSSAGVTVETPSETPDSIITEFVVSAEPKWVVSDGMIYFAGAGYTYSALLVTMDLAPSFFIRVII